MLQRLRNRAQGQEGFTLIELLVVILIIGILAAVAIPTFLSQTSKATDSNLQAALSTVQTTEATYATSNSGGYLTGLTSTQTTSANGLIAIEPSLSAPWGTYQLTTAALSNGHAGFSVTGTSTSSQGGQFTLSYDATTGAVTKSCTLKNTGGCNNSNTW